MTKHHNSKISQKIPSIARHGAPLTKADAANHLQSLIDGYRENYETRFKELAPVRHKLAHYQNTPPKTNPYNLSAKQGELVGRALDAIEAGDFDTATSFIARISNT